MYKSAVANIQISRYVGLLFIVIDVQLKSLQNILYDFHFSIYNYRIGFLKTY